MQKMTKDLGGAKIYLKREDLNHTGAHKISHVLGQALLAKKWEGKIDRGNQTGQHGVATATAARAYGDGMCRVCLEFRRCDPAGFERIGCGCFGAEVIPVTTGTATQKMPFRKRA